MNTVLVIGRFLILLILIIAKSIPNFDFDSP